VRIWLAVLDTAVALVAECEREQATMSTFYRYSFDKRLVLFGASLAFAPARTGSLSPTTVGCGRPSVS
jgi:hypothetical protein